jgi:hypothetical protein
MIGKLVAEVATRCRAEPVDLCSAHGMVRRLADCSVRAMPWLDRWPAGWAESGQVKAGLCCGAEVNRRMVWLGRD